MLKAILFDMDGVLLDSTYYVWQSFNMILKDEGVQFSDEDIKRYLGLSLRDMLERWQQEFGIAERDVDQFSREAGEKELELMKEKLTPNADLNALISEARSRGVKLAVATASQRWRAERILDLLGIRQSLDALVTAQEAERHKPHPDIFLEAARQVGAEPEACVVIEDAAAGIDAARAGGMKAVAMQTPYQTREELSHANLIIKGFAELSVQRLRELFGD